MKFDIACGSVSDLWSIWNNNIVCTTWNQLSFIYNICTKSKILFYIYDIDWHTTMFSTQEQQKMLNKVDKIFCRCEDHQNLIDGHFGIKAEILPSYNYERLIEI